MTTYKAPQREFDFLIKDLFAYEDHINPLGFEDMDIDVVRSVVPEAARFFEQVVAPSNFSVDKQQAVLAEGGVMPAPELAGLTEQLRDSGWSGLAAKTEYGGAGFPLLVNVAVQEMLQSANLSFSLMPLLTFGVVHALDLYASDEQKRLFLPPLVQSAWSGTMNLTEPQAGTDLGAIRTKAVKNGDHYLISGQKIFITWGDHPYTDNIIHLVLARTPDAPEGSRGISMFIVPKYLINEDGSIGERNDVKPVGVEHKLGIHGSPTCTMQFGENGGAIGYLVGEENKGLVYMFAMMNTARLAVGHQGVAVAERAYQQAVDYALDRVQGKTVTGEEGGTIIQHPDVKRMLLQMRAMTEAGRALSFLSQASEDVAHHHPDEAVRKAAALRVDVLTPLVKAWCTEAGVEVTSMGVQVHGGTGFIEETGAAQHYRDARILPIYEGTNGIQALDFIGRKTLADGGNGVSLLLAECGESVAALANPDDEVGAMCDEVGRAIKQCERALAYLAANSDTAPGIAFDFMMLFANTVCGWLMLKSAAIAVEQRNKDASDRFWVQKLATAKFFIEQILPRNYTYLAGVLRGCAATSMLEDGDFSR